MKKTVSAVLFVIYSIVAITVTVLLLSYNEYNISEIGNYTIYVVKDDSLEPQYKQGSILIIKNTSDKHVQVGDELFVYKVITSQEFEVVNAKLSQKTQQGRFIVYGMDNGEMYANEYFIGRAEDTIVINGPWGTILSILSSKWGYLFCIVIVSLLLFLQEVFNLIIELKYSNVKVKSGTKKSTTTKKAGTPAKKPVGAKPAVKTATRPVAKPAVTVQNATTVSSENSNPQTGEKEEG